MENYNMRIQSSDISKIKHQLYNDYSGQKQRINLMNIWTIDFEFESISCIVIRQFVKSWKIVTLYILYKKSYSTVTTEPN